MPRKRSTSWPEYVASIVEPGERQSDVARRTGLDQATISRWVKGERKGITSSSVAKFARGYGRPVLEAFVAAGFLTPAEAGMKRSDFVDLSGVSAERLLHELQRRLADELHAHERDGELDGAAS